MITILDVFWNETIDKMTMIVGIDETSMLKIVSYVPFFPLLLHIVYIVIDLRGNSFFFYYFRKKILTFKVYKSMKIEGF